MNGFYYLVTLTSLSHSQKPDQTTAVWSSLTGDEPHSFYRNVTDNLFCDQDPPPHTHFWWVMLKVITERDYSCMSLYILLQGNEGSVQHLEHLS